MLTSPLLTIAIPSYNRSAKLDAQIRWAAEALEGAWECCQLMVSNNASSDDTAEVCASWKERLGERFSYVNQPTSLGLVGNVAFCLENALGRFVWVVGDDDDLRPDAVAVVIEAIRRRPDLGLIHLNHRAVSGFDQSIVYERFYPWQDDRWAEDGRDLMEACIAHREGGVMFITALIVRKDLAIEAMAAWPEGLRNLAYPLYISAFAAMGRPMLVTGRTLCDSLYYVNSWANLSVQVEYHDVPQVYLRLAVMGYNRQLMRALVRRRVEARRLKALVKLALRHPRLFAWLMRSVLGQGGPESARTPLDAAV